MNINKLKLLLSAIVCITDIYADIETNLQNTAIQQVIYAVNLSFIEPIQNEGSSNLFDNNSDSSLESILDALEQNPNNVAEATSNEPVVNGSISDLNNGFMQADHQDNDQTIQNISQQQMQTFDTGICHELGLDLRPGHMYCQTTASSCTNYSVS